MSRAVASRPGAAPAKAAKSRVPDSYLRQSEMPLHSLVFLLPLLALFELGTYFHPSDPIAFRLLQLFFSQLGADGRFIPALSLVGILIAWHLARRDPWKIKIETLWGMAMESMILAIPLLALGISSARWNIHVPLWVRSETWRDDAILSLGAGIYEELVFRLILMTALMLLLSDLLRLPKFWSSLLMVSISAILFSLYHYLGHETFQWRSFAFRTAAGIYFAGLFLTRGFGITAGCHIFYDILIVALQTLAVH
ncbi:MAG: CPBP family intramembrane glutamic endopeptidase [Tepidisphaeraceae bacterium]|jgi:membrane protease YdiL (CAAX protease family)